MIKDLFKLEVVGDEVVCKPLTERLKDFIRNDSSFTEEITNKINKQKKYVQRRQGYIGFPDHLLFSDGELEEMKSNNVFFQNNACVFFHGRDIAELRFDFMLLGGSPFPFTERMTIVEYFTYWQEFTYDEFLSSGLNISGNIRAITSSRNSHDWSHVPILEHKDGSLVNLSAIYKCIDGSTRSTLSVFDVLDLRSKVKKDKKFLSYVSVMDSLTREQVVDKYGDLFTRWEISSKLFQYIGDICVDLMEYGESNSIPELLDIKNCYLLSMITGHLKEYRHRVGVLYNKVNHDGHWWNKVEEIYIDVLSNHLNLSQCDTLFTKVAGDDLAGLTFVAPETFHQFLENLKNSISLGFKDDREKEKREIEAINRRNEKISQIIHGITEQLETTSVAKLLSELKNLEPVPNTAHNRCYCYPDTEYKTIEGELAALLVANIIGGMPRYSFGSYGYSYLLDRLYGRK